MPVDVWLVIDDRHEVTDDQGKHEVLVHPQTVTLQRPAIFVQVSFTLFTFIKIQEGQGMGRSDGKLTDKIWDKIKNVIFYFIDRMSMMREVLNERNLRIGYEFIIFVSILHFLLLLKPADKIMEPVGLTTNVIPEVNFCEIVEVSDNLSVPSY